MCTVTVVRSGDTLRLACNRDERRERPHAHPPFVTRAGELFVLTPQDPVARGTWIAANGAGLVLAVLNADDGRRPAPPARTSRGLIIPSLVHCASLDEVVYEAGAIPHGDFAPFTLLAADAQDVIELTVTRGEWDAHVHALTEPRLFTSSSLGHAIVEGPRRLLFEQMFATPWDLEAQQDAYHVHRWRDRPAVSVHMSRPDACTVSTAIVEVTPRQVRMTYHPANDAAGTPVGLVIDRQNVERAAAGRDRREHAAV